jgi:hypothetical protein
MRSLLALPSSLAVDEVHERFWQERARAVNLAPSASQEQIMQAEDAQPDKRLTSQKLWWNAMSWQNTEKPGQEHGPAGHHQNGACRSFIFQTLCYVF